MINCRLARHRGHYPPHVVRIEIDNDIVQVVRLPRRKPNVEKHSDRDEEETRENFAEGNQFRHGLLPEHTDCHDHPGQKDPQRQRCPRKSDVPCRADADQKQREDEQLPLSGLGGKGGNIPGNALCG